MSFPRVDVRRAKPILGLMALLALSILTINALGYAFYRLHPGFLWKEAWLNPDERSRIEARLAASMAAHTPAPSASAGSLVVVLGLSTARVGLDEAILGKYITPPCQVVNLGSSGGSFQELSFFTEGLNLEDLKPDLVVLGIHPIWLAGRGQERPSPLWSSSIHGPAASIDLHTPRLWLIHSYRRIHNALHNFLTQHSLQRALRLRPPPVAPMAPPPTAPQERRAPAAFLQAQREGFRSMGWLSPMTDPPGTIDERTAWASILHRSRSSATKVVVILFPESREFQDAVHTPQMTKWFTAQLPPSGVEIIDARNAVSESGFYDLVHLNQEGKMEFSSWLGACLNDRIIQRAIASPAARGVPPTL